MTVPTATVPIEIRNAIGDAQPVRYTTGTYGAVNTDVDAHRLEEYSIVGVSVKESGRVYVRMSKDL